MEKQQKVTKQSAADGGQSKAVDIGAVGSSRIDAGKNAPGSRETPGNRGRDSVGRSGKVVAPKIPGGTLQYGKAGKTGYRDPGKGKLGGPGHTRPANKMSGSGRNEPPKGTTGQGRGGAADVKGPRPGGGKSEDKKPLRKIPFQSADKTLPKATGPKPLG